MNVALPWFVYATQVDEAIQLGQGIDLDVTCKVCGVWGDYLTWSMGPTGHKLCPKCGSYDTERVGETKK